MSTNMYQEFEPDIRMTGDYLDVDGTLNVDGITTLAGGVTVTGSVTATLLCIAAPTGTTVGAAWTSGTPLLTNAQQCITVKCGSTSYKIPVWTV